MSRRRTQAKKQEENEKGSGLLSTMLVAGGAAAMGFMAAKLWGDYQDCQTNSQQGPSSGATQQPRNSSWSDEANKARGEKRAARDKNVPENITCIVCMVNPREVILNPCGHVCLCIDCADKVPNLCPVCRQTIADKKIIYLP